MTPSETVPKTVSMPTREILAAHAIGARLLTTGGMDAEPPETALAVEEHRWAWRPDVPSVVLIAESHVFTSADDLAVSVVSERLPRELRHLPTAFVRLIYCLGYGQTSVLSGPPACGNPGTPQFWKIFARIAGTGPYPTRVPAATRLAWKIRTLTALRDRGVWLLDASLHAIYAPQRCPKATTPLKLRQTLHETWWQEYGSPTLDQIADPYVCIIGKMTADTLAAIGVPFHNWIYQPQAARGAGVKMERGWSDLLAAIPTPTPESER